MGTRLNAVRLESRGFAVPMLENMMARMLPRAGYRSRSLTTNERQFPAAARAIEELVATTPEPVLRGRRPVAPLPGVTPVMQGWSAYMTIDHVNGVHEAMLELIPQLEAGRQLDIGVSSRFDHPGECGPGVMPRFRDLVTRVALLPESHAFIQWPRDVSAPDLRPAEQSRGLRPLGLSSPYACTPRPSQH